MAKEPDDRLLAAAADRIAAAEPPSSPLAGKPLPAGAVMACVSLALCLLLYGWTADFPMTFDDSIYLEENAFFLNSKAFAYLADFRNFAQAPARSGMDPDLTANMLLRPFAYATFYWNHSFDGFEPRWFRVTNIAIHALNGWLVFALISRLGNATARSTALDPSSVRFIAVTSSLLFLTHPLATESVTYIVQRFSSLVAMFMLSSLLLHFAGLESHGKRRLCLQAGSVLTALLGMLTKEIAVTVPLLAVALDRLVIGTRWQDAARRALPLLACLPVVPGLVIAVSLNQSAGGWSVGQSLNLVNSRDQPWTHGQYIFTQCTVLVDYLRLIVWPSGQNLHPQPPVHDSLAEGPVWRSIALLAGVLTTAAWLRSCPAMRAHGRILFAFVVWFFITIAVSSSIIPLPDMMAEHRTYVPSIGLLTASACLLDRVRLLGRGLAASLPASAAVIGLSAATCLRNETWRSEVSLWKDTVAKSPRRTGAWNNLGVAYAEAGQTAMAEATFRKSLEIEPTDYAALNNLAVILLREQRWRDCHAVLEDLFAAHPAALANRELIYYEGLALVGMGRNEEGARVMERILFENPDHFLASKYLGIALLQLRQFHRARAYLEHAGKMEPDDPDITRALSVLATALAQP
jgi:Flp pilus assembly protein TadD